MWGLFSRAVSLAEVVWLVIAGISIVVSVVAILLDSAALGFVAGAICTFSIVRFCLHP